MKIKTADLIGPPLDWAMAKALGKQNLVFTYGKVWAFYEHPTSNEDGSLDFKRLNPSRFGDLCAYSTSGSEVIEIMERERISALFDAKAGLWQASTGPRGVGPTLRIAVCRCFVASEIGDWVDVPKELMK